MNPHRINQNLRNRILPLIVIPVIFLVAGLCFDYYYDLNDDVVIKDILSGAFSGQPDGHTNQILYPLGWLISLVYRFMPQLPVYGLFLLGCYGLSFYFLGLGSLRYYQKLRGKLLLLLLEGGIFLSLFLWELVYVQYSVVCGLLAGTACFWFYTTGRELEPGEFWLANLPSLLLTWLAFLLRSEMLLLLTPFFAAVGVYHWYEEVKREEAGCREQQKLYKRIFSKKNNLKYLAFAAVMVLGCVAFWGMDRLAYGTEEWQGYRRFFDARTRVYDYTWYPKYEENQDFYEKIGVTEEQVGLIDSYNFGLDPAIDANTLDKIASFGERAKHQGSLGYRLKSGVWEMGYRMVAASDAPYNYFVLVAYGLVIALAVMQKDKSCIWKLLLLGIARSISWMYLLLAGRVVARIAHPLYFVEFLILLALLARELHDRPLWNRERYYRRIALLVLVVISGAGALLMFPRVAAEQTRREKVNKTIEEFQSYAAAHPENYYLMDVYSTVDFSEKLFAGDSESYKNYDLLGGWVFHSPLQKKKAEYHSGEAGFALSEAMLKEGVYFVMESGGDKEPIINWYEAHGIVLEFVEEARVGSPENPLVIYQLIKGKERDS